MSPAERFAVTDVLHRYCSTIDRRDRAGLRAVLADDAVATYGAAEPLRGAAEIVRFVSGVTDSRAWSHHLLSVYRVELDGPGRAVALSYLVSHSEARAAPGVVTQTLGWYDDVLERSDRGWVIISKTMSVVWSDATPRPQPRQ